MSDWSDVLICCRKKQKTSTSDDDDSKQESDDDGNPDEEDDETMPWSKVEGEDGVLTLWPGTPVCETDLYGPKSLHLFFEKAFGIQVKPVGCVTTLPDIEDGEEVEGTGGRIDFFFFVKDADAPKFALTRFPFGMRWWGGRLLQRRRAHLPSGVSPGVPSSLTLLNGESPYSIYMTVTHSRAC